jgi:glycogen debranching enzyme
VACRCTSIGGSAGTFDLVSDAWTFAGESADLGRGAGGSVTLVDQSTFCLSAASGDVHPGGAQGLFAVDTRLLSQLELRVGGAVPETLSSATERASAATFVLRTSVGDGNAHLAVLRRRTVDENGLDETVEVRSFARELVDTDLTLALAADLADLFAVKEGRVGRTRTRADRAADDTLTFEQAGGHDGRKDHHGIRRVRVELEGQPELTTADGQARVRWPVHLEPASTWSARWSVRPDDAGGGDRPPGSPGGAAARHAVGFAAPPTLDTDIAPLAGAYRQSLRDLAALRLYGRDPDGLPVVAAGAPWFMTLFGRDSLLTSWMTLLVDHDLAVGVLEGLARLQGTRTDERTEEQPGRIPHEVRYGGAQVYYGTADATPLFVMLLGECLRWGVAWERLERLLPHADRALEWVERYGDRDGDGYVEYERLSPQGLPNQGWKDSSDAIVFADGTLAQPPIALCEVQGYVYAAYRARAALARHTGDHDRARDCDARADRLRLHFDRDFWLDEAGCYALALDGGKRKVDAVASNMGHVLWTGLARPDRAARVARLLAGPDLFSGWGVRTLASSMAAYDPLSYQRGSVWPHDTAIAVAGLARYGHRHEAAEIGRGLLEAAQQQDDRLPELLGGFARDDVDSPVPYPTACSPQAWASAAPLLVLRTLLGLEPDVPAGRVQVAPARLDDVHELVLDGVPVAGGRLTVRLDGSAELAGVPDAVISR